MSSSALPQERISIDVSFYNADEKAKLMKFPTSADMQRIVDDGLDIPTAEFLSYYLFHRKRLGSGDYKSYEEIGRRINQSLSSLDCCVDFTGRSICTHKGVSHQLNEISEHVGEAVGLSVISSIHGLSEADWTPIQEQRGPKATPTLDFEYASDGHRFVQVELKGSSVENNQVLSEAIYTQKGKITEKKIAIRDQPVQRISGLHEAIRYGTITALDPRPDGTAKCWLVDPDVTQIPDSPRRHKLISKLRYVRDWVAIISPRSQFAAALTTRLADMEHMDNPYELDGVPLLRGSGESFAFHRGNWPNANWKPFLYGRSHVKGYPASGLLVPISDTRLFFLGMQEELLALTAQQSLERFLHAQYRTGTSEEVINCNTSLRFFNNLRIPGAMAEVAEERDGRILFPLGGFIHYSPAGLAFGVLPLPSKKD
jgi:hypothetical protein